MKIKSYIWILLTLILFSGCNCNCAAHSTSPLPEGEGWHVKCHSGEKVIFDERGIQGLRASNGGTFTFTLYKEGKAERVVIQANCVARKHTI